jgi:hypothetical protein
MTPDANKIRSLSPLLLCLLGPGIWAAHFFVMYASEVLVCTALNLPSSQRHGLLIIALAATALASISLLWIIASLRGWSAFGDERAFLRNASVTLAVLSLIGVMWTALPAGLLSACSER